MPQVVPSQVVWYIDQAFPTWAPLNDVEPAKLDYTHSGRVSAIVSLAERVPNHLLVLEPGDYAELIAAIEVLRSRLAMWHQHGSSSTWSGEPVRTIRDLLARCPDECPRASTHALAFVPDVDLRTELRFDLSPIETALANGQWKAATVLAGSAIEALLLWKLSSLPFTDVTSAEASALKRSRKTLDEWALHDLIEVAAICPSGAPVLRADTATQARLVKNFRNLIHPGRAVRLAQKCDRGTAYAAVAGVELVVRDLTP